MSPTLTLMLQLFGVLLVGVSLAAAAHALLHKKDPRSALGWVALIIFSPVIGIVVYLLLGVNRVRRRAKRIREERGESESTGALIPGTLESLERSFTKGNRVECLLEGRDTLEAVSTLLRNAHHHICLSVYIFESKGVGEWLIAELGAAVRRGVHVRVLLDGIGSLYSGGGTRKALLAVGVEVGVFLRPTLLPPAWHINLRNHRKLLVADGERAIVGGTNVRNAYVVQDGHREPEATDVNFLIEGQVVKDIQDVFADDWFTATERVLNLAQPVHTPVGEPAAHSADARCRVTIDGPDNDVDLISLLYMAAISEAKHRVRIVTPYFLPPHELVACLQVAAIRGVCVEIVLPANNNLPFMNWATRNMLPQLLRYGVHVYYQQGPFDHSKLFVVDNDYALVGSANVDARSLRLNFEISVEIRSAAIGQTLNEHIDQCVSTSDALSMAELEARSLPVRIRDAMLWLLTPYL